MSDRYVLHHDGTWFYYVAGAARYTQPGMVVLADGEQMQPCGQAGWYSTGREAGVITTVRPQPHRITGYRLGDPDAVSVRYPLTLTVEEYDRRRDLDDEEALFRLYDRVTEPVEPSAEDDAGPWLRLDGEPPAQDGPTWVAALPYVLSERDEYRHLFPGYMPGFRDHMMGVLKALPDVQYVFEWKRLGAIRGLEVTLSLPFDKPVTEYVPARNQDGSVSRSRKGRTVQARASRKLELPVPWRIDGPDRAAAAAEWAEREAQLVAIVTDSSVAVCSACGGHGYIIPEVQA